MAGVSSITSDGWFGYFLVIPQVADNVFRSLFQVGSYIPSFDSWLSIGCIFNSYFAGFPFYKFERWSGCHPSCFINFSTVFSLCGMRGIVLPRVEVFDLPFFGKKQVRFSLCIHKRNLRQYDRISRFRFRKKFQLKSIWSTSFSVPIYQGNSNSIMLC